MSKILVGLFGSALSSVNYGCTALALTQINLIQDIAKDQGKQVEYWVFSDETEDTILKTRKLLNIDDIHSKYVIRLKTGFSGFKRLRADINACDLIIDITYGDSFSDIYGKKFFFLYSLPKYYAIKSGRPFVLAPQTIGPFYSSLAKKVARWIINRTDYIFTRDLLSLECVKELSPSSDPKITSDLAMNLPFSRINRTTTKNCIQVGLNVSSMLWTKEGEKSNITLKLSYRELTYRLLDYLRDNYYETHLIAHVYENGEFTEYGLAKQLNEEYPDSTILAPSFSDPIEAKSYMSKLDVMIGSRMHATIGAFSAGVPVIPMAYSRKFEGLYSTIGYDYIIDCNRETVETALEKVQEYLKNLSYLKTARDIAYEKALSLNQNYFNALSDIISTIGCENTTHAENESKGKME